MNRIQITPGMRVFAIAGFISCQLSLIAQQPALQIVTPVAGSIIVPGQPFTVTASVSPGTAFSGVFAIAQNVGISPTLSNGPFTFSFVAPGGGFLGSLKLTAVGITAAGGPVFSAPVTISVETSTALSQLSVGPPQVGFSFAGQQIPLIVTGTFADGTTADLTLSTQISYSSNDPTVALVGSNGLVTAVGSGPAISTQVVVASGNVLKEVTVTLPKTIRGDLNGDGRVDQDDLNVILAAVNTAATKPIDARDLNGDGVINALDARVLVTLCSRAGCATH